jgi:3-hydroxyacyl-[acyl-carrier-protein] dehydratase
MRWYWIDRFEKFVSGVEATTIKNVTFSEEVVYDYLPGYSHYPHALIIEGMAQTGGLLLSQLGDFTQKIVLAKVSKAEFHGIAQPGDQLRLNAKLLSRQTDGAIVEGRVERNGQLMAELGLTFAILDDSFGKEQFFIPSDLCRVLRALRLFDVGVDAGGNPLPVPSFLADAEQAALQTNAAD